jgi:hypothetical protein
MQRPPLPTATFMCGDSWCHHAYCDAVSTMIGIMSAKVCLSSRHLEDIAAPNQQGMQ